jgi:hypothetical protein
MIFQLIRSRYLASTIAAVSDFFNLAELSCHLSYILVSIYICNKFNFDKHTLPSQDGCER